MSEHSLASLSSSGTFSEPGQVSVGHLVKVFEVILTWLHNCITKLNFCYAHTA